MSRRNRALMQHRQMTVGLSLTIVTADEDGERLHLVPLVYLTGLVMFVWQLRRLGAVLRWQLYHLGQRLDLGLSCGEIFIKAAAFGLGVRL